MIVLGNTFTHRLSWVPPKYLEQWLGQRRQAPPLLPIFSGGFGSTILQWKNPIDMFDRDIFINRCDHWRSSLKFIVTSLCQLQFCGSPSTGVTLKSWVFVDQETLLVKLVSLFFWREVFDFYTVDHFQIIPLTIQRGGTSSSPERISGDGNAKKIQH